jgi:hypothetical protein
MTRLGPFGLPLDCVQFVKKRGREPNPQLKSRFPPFLPPNKLWTALADKFEATVEGEASRP